MIVNEVVGEEEEQENCAICFNVIDEKMNI